MRKGAVEGGSPPKKHTGELIRKNGVTSETSVTSVTAKNRTFTTPPAKQWVAVNERNLRIGESHPRAVLTDHDVELLLELRGEGFSYRWLSRTFEISIKQAWRICTGKQRSQIPDSHRRVK